eukprot:2798826-Prymnesium_polylepis.1
MFSTPEPHRMMFIGHSAHWLRALKRSLCHFGACTPCARRTCVATSHFQDVSCTGGVNNSVLVGQEMRA